ncbi:hypothetical protein CM240_3198 [Clostridium bornimense]|uniref:Carrier domain-containing protein n=1 Tax=Clostridium bornimense TaxID=1216932 RepID=W6SKD6_9CLOT|nr:acyl carrier protein [Clostridium bornimense]CDM70315.1 hypothetical protein CM240_3198 [Clostridium bornimense]
MDKKIIEILADIKEDEKLKDTLTGESSIIDDVGLDSLEMINFLLMIEEEFKKEINFERLEYSNLSSINTFVTFLEAL